MFKPNLNSVLKAKSKALKVFTDTQVKFDKAITEASLIISDNVKEILSKKDEIKELDRANDELLSHIGDMQKTVAKINAIVGE